MPRGPDPLGTLTPGPPLGTTGFKETTIGVARHGLWWMAIGHRSGALVTVSVIPTTHSAI